LVILHTIYPPFICLYWEKRASACFYLFIFGTKFDIFACISYIDDYSEHMKDQDRAFFENVVFICLLVLSGIISIFGVYKFFGLFVNWSCWHNIIPVLLLSGFLGGRVIYLHLFGPKSYNLGAYYLEKYLANLPLLSS